MVTSIQTKRKQNRRYRRTKGMKEQITNAMKFPELVKLAFDKLWGRD